MGDNVNTNKSMSNKSGISLIGCCSHCFLLAVVDLLTAESDIVMKLNAVMVKLG